jgi:decaprenylphospho-beta-D-ribofuranose 2-oxidase
MSSVELKPTPLAGPVRLLSGWGRTLPSRARVLRPTSEEQVAELLASGCVGGAIARGAGRSYGDPAQNAGGAVLDMTAMSSIEALDPELGEAHVQAGVTFEQLLQDLAVRGMTLPVVPGTRHLTVGGAIASDVHGKNHPVAGSFAAQLREMTVCTPGEGPLRALPETDLFRATAGGMGLTGVVTSARLRTIPLRNPMAVADIDRVASVEEAMALMSSSERTHTHTIAWLDLMAPGRHFARAVVTRSSEGPEQGPERDLRMPRAGRLTVPAGVPSGLLAPAVVRAFNEALWLRAPRSARGRLLDAGEQLFPLDKVADWNRVYGREGLIQYQFVVPPQQDGTVRSVLELLRGAGLPMYLAVIKRFGSPSGGMLSFPVPGWTLAVDIPAGAPGLSRALARADELVATAGGRLYLAKDARMSAQTLQDTYPSLPSFRELRARLDPHDVLRSDMGRRLGLSR